jgi:hypothetical protein
MKLQFEFQLTYIAHIIFQNVTSNVPDKFIIHKIGTTYITQKLRNSNGRRNHTFFLLNPILFAICTGTFSKLCINV